MKIFFTIGLCLLVLGQAQAGISRPDDVLPWPWGSECPFPWTKIEGEWISKGELAAERFTFIVQGEQSSNSRVLLVQRFSAEGELVGTGRGLAPLDDRVVRAAMVGVGSEQGKNYWAIVRTYTEKQKKSCARNKQVTVITLRSVEGSSEAETSMVLEKDDAQRRIGP